MPDLATLSMSGASKVQVEGAFTAPDGVFRMELSGATVAKGLTVEGRRARLSMSGAAKCNDFKGTFSQVDLQGSGAVKADMEIDADEWDIDISGAAGMKLKGKRCRTMTLEASGAAKTELGISSGRLSYEGSGASVLQALDAPAANAASPSRKAWRSRPPASPNARTRPRRAYRSGPSASARWPTSRRCRSWGPGLFHQHSVAPCYLL